MSAIINVNDAVRRKHRLSLTKSSSEPQTENGINLFPQIAKPDHKLNQVVDNQSDDSLEDFKSPTKLPVPKKKISRAQQQKEWASRPPPPPHGFKNTQEMIVQTWKTLKAQDTEYFSENEFEIFRKKKRTTEQQVNIKKSDSPSNANRKCATLREELQEKDVKPAEKSNSLKEAGCQTIELVDKETRDVGVQCDFCNNQDDSRIFSHDNERDVKIDSVLVQKLTSSTSISADSKHDFLPPENVSIGTLTNKQSYREKFQNLKVQNVMISDSEDDLIPNSQHAAAKPLRKLINPCKKEDSSLTSLMSSGVTLKLSDTSKHELSLETAGTADNTTSVFFFGNATENLQKQMRLLKKKVRSLPSLRGSTRSLHSLTFYWKHQKCTYLRKLWWINMFYKKQYIQSRIRLNQQNR